MHSLLVVTRMVNFLINTLIPILAHISEPHATQQALIRTFPHLWHVFLRKVFAFRMADSHSLTHILNRESVRTGSYSGLGVSCGLDADSVTAVGDFFDFVQGVQKLDGMVLVAADDWGP